jgi:hypothetical protein
MVYAPVEDFSRNTGLVEPELIELRINLRLFGKVEHTPGNLKAR